MLTAIKERTTRLKRKVGKIDLAPVKYKLRQRLNWSAKRLSDVERKYRNFLILMARHRGVFLVPSEDVDEFWHMHILFTRKYSSDCEAAFGRFFHHQPYTGSDGNELANRREETKVLYEQTFGEPMDDNDHNPSCTGGSSCSMGT